MNSGDRKIKHTEKPFTALLGHHKIRILSDCKFLSSGCGEEPPGLRLRHCSSLKCAELVCSWEHLAAACPQPSLDAAPRAARMEEPVMQQNVGEQSRIHTQFCNAAHVAMRGDCGAMDGRAGKLTLENQYQLQCLLIAGHWAL